MTPGAGSNLHHLKLTRYVSARLKSGRRRFDSCWVGHFSRYACPMWEPVEQDINVYIAGTFDETLTLYQDSAKTLPLNLTGYVAQLTTDSGLDLNTTNGRLVLGGAAGTIRISMPTSQTSTFTGGVTHYRLKITDVAGAVTFPVIGTMRFIHA